MSENCELKPETFQEAVCIDTGRVYDSCMDRDCIENARVYFSEAGQTAIQNAISCKVKCCEVADVKIDVEPVAFKRGYYSCDLTFFFTLTAEVTVNPNACPQEFCGIAAFTKKVILCGSEGNVKVFTSTMRVCDDDITVRGSNLPKCTVQCVDPVVLDSKICEICRCKDMLSDIPNSVLSAVNGEITTNGNRGLFVTLGLFSIVQLVRNVQLLVPSYSFCMPQKECREINDSPCDMFSKIKFPVDEFFPKSCDKGHCCCSNNEDD